MFPVFGVPIEITVQRQQSTRAIPHIVVKCADYLVLSGKTRPLRIHQSGGECVFRYRFIIFKHLKVF